MSELAPFVGVAQEPVDEGGVVLSAACVMCQLKVIESEMTDGLCIECLKAVSEEPVSDFAELQRDLPPDAFKDLGESAVAVTKQKQVENLLAQQEKNEYGSPEYEEITRELDKLLGC